MNMLFALYGAGGYVGICLLGYWFCVWFVDDDDDDDEM